MSFKYTMKDALKRLIVVGRQGDLCGMEHGSCIYETTEGKHCAFGALLTDNEIAAVHAGGWNDGTAAEELMEAMPQLQERMDGLTAHDANILQGIHDRFTSAIPSAPATQVSGHLADVYSKLLHGHPIVIGNFDTEGESTAFQASFFGHAPNGNPVDCVITLKPEFRIDQGEVF